MRNNRAGKFRTAGFTLVELMVSVALMAMLMAAVALATKGAADASSYENDKGRSLVEATLALNRVDTDIRRAADVTANNAHSITVTLPDASVWTYSWDGVAGHALMEVSPGHPQGNVLVAHVNDFTAVVTQVVRADNHAVVAGNVQVTLQTVEGTTNTQLQATTRVRRNIM
jgi:prepilin-type N-terminal cleavage/methylation domain-containing protein